MALTTDDFVAFMDAVHGYPPFSWQTRLCARVLGEGWPRVLQLPTASGKTAIMDVAVFALAAGAASARRRIAFVVDRRVVVDEASRRARHLARALTDARSGVVARIADELRHLGGSDVPLVTATLRGGTLRDDNWARSPAQAVLVCSTVNQVGSRLLFRGYGCRSPRAWPIHAGLLGTDSLIIVDEAHCAQPFCETALAIADRYARWADVPVGPPVTLLRMSATLGEGADFGLDDADRSNPVLAARLTARKPATLHLATPAKGQTPREAVADAVVDHAMRVAEEAPRVVGIVVNRVATARQVFERLPVPEARKVLLTGRVRPLERDHLLAMWEPRISATPGRARPAESVFVVATQCVEVGANLDFDALVTECAALDALRQRCGRLNRLGAQPSAPAVIVGDAAGVATGAEPDPIYGDALQRTWQWLHEIAAADRRAGQVDFGIEALESVLPDNDLAILCTPTRHAPILLPTTLDLLSQTSPEPTPFPDIGLFLHGPSIGADDVTLVWRADLPADRPEDWGDIVAMLPPVTGEGCTVPFVAAQAWLAGCVAAPGADADVSGQAPEADPPLGSAGTALRWCGSDDAEVITGAQLRPGDTVIIPCGYGGCDRYGWNAESHTPVLDIGDAAAHAAHRSPILRLHDAVTSAWRPSSQNDGERPSWADAVADLGRWAAGDEDVDATACLGWLAAAGDVPDWVRSRADTLRRDRRRKALHVRGCLAIVGSRPGQRPAGEEAESEFSGSEDTSSLTVPVTLRRHQAGVAQWATRFADSCVLDDDRRRDLVAAAHWHDLGKADRRFQVLMAGGDDVAAALLSEPLAKSGLRWMDRPTFMRAARKARYPSGGRHEFQSLALLEATPTALHDTADAALVLHLVSSHHGYARALAPVVNDAEPVLVRVADAGTPLSASSDHGAHRLDSGVADRFWLLQQRYGWWGLAWLEALLRLADHRRSEEEEQFPEEAS